jgi:hypothetical protein
MRFTSLMVGMYALYLGREIITTGINLKKPVHPLDRR